MVALAVAVLVFAAGACLAEAAGHHSDAGAPYCAAVIALTAIPVPLALGGVGRVAPVAVGALPPLALDLAAPPPEA